MPSQKPRLALTLPPELEVALTDLAAAVEKPVSSVATGLLVEMIPQLEGLAKIVRASKAGNQAAAKRALQHLMGDAMAEMMTATQPELFTKRKGGKR